MSLDLPDFCLKQFVNYCSAPKEDATRSKSDVNKKKKCLKKQNKCLIDAMVKKSMSLALTDLF